MGVIGLVGGCGGGGGGGAAAAPGVGGGGGGGGGVAAAGAGCFFMFLVLLVVMLLSNGNKDDAERSNGGGSVVPLVLIPLLLRLVQLTAEAAIAEQLSGSASALAAQDLVIHLKLWLSPSTGAIGHVVQRRHVLLQRYVLFLL